LRTGKPENVEGKKSTFRLAAIKGWESPGRRMRKTRTIDAGDHKKSKKRTKQMQPMAREVAQEKGNGGNETEGKKRDGAKKGQRIYHTIPEVRPRER